jgi:predicted TIM-barrel fold metal-dependent hydrolase
MKRFTNDEVIEYAAKHADVAIPFASINPKRGKTRAPKRAPRGARADQRVEAAPANHGVLSQRPRGVSAVRGLCGSELPVLFHTGHSGIGTGMRGGGGIRLKYGHPMPIDDVAVDFPDMPIIMAHPSFPVAGRGDLRLPAQAAGLHRSVRLVAEVLFADAGAVRQLAAQAQSAVRIRLSVLTPDRWLADFEKAAFKDEVRPLILKENAIKLFGLG